MSVKWQKVKLGDLGRVVTGATPPTKHSEYFDGDYLFVTPSDLEYDSRNILQSERTISQQGFEKFKNRFVPVGAVMYTCIASIGKMGIATSNVLTNQQINSIVPSDEVDGCFLYYLLRNETPKIQGVNAGCAVPIINKRDFEAIEVTIPPLPVQKKIASILSAYDDLIENNRRRIAILEEMARKVYRKRFGGKKANGTIAELASANDECYKAGSLPSEINYVDIASVSTGRIDGKTRMDAKNAPGRARRIARHGDVIWSNVRPNLRAYALVLSPEAKDVFSTGFTVLRAAGNLYSYLYLTVTQDKFVSYLEGCVSGATYPAVRPDDFLRAEVYVPSNDERLEFQELTEPLYDQVCTLSEENCKLAEARDALLPKLMSRMPV